MPWLTIIMALLSFFTAKKNGASNTKAALIAGAVGAGTYYVSHETEWGRENLGALDGVDLSAGTKEPVIADGSTAEGTKVVTGADGKPITPSTGIMDVLKEWGASGTATVVGAAGATGALLTGNGKWLLIAGAALVAIMVLK